MVIRVGTSTITVNSGAVMAAPSGNTPLFFARAWVNFNSTTIVGSGNVTSVADNTDSFTISFTTAMPDENYAFAAGARLSSDASGQPQDFPIIGAYRGNSYLAGSLRITSIYRSSVTSMAQPMQVGDITTVIILR